MKNCVIYINNGYPSGVPVLEQCRSDVGSRHSSVGTTSVSDTGSVSDECRNVRPIRYWIPTSFRHRIPTSFHTGFEHRSDTGFQHRSDTGFQYRSDTGFEYRSDTGFQYRSDTGFQYRSIIKGQHLFGIRILNTININNILVFIIFI